MPFGRTTASNETHGGPMADSEPYPYQLGNYYGGMPIPKVPEHCVGVDAGPLRFEVESRELTNEILRGHMEAGNKVIEDVTFDDYGPSLHVCGAQDGLEHLRFDCFVKEPHYHYVRHAEGGNLICRIDDIAEGDPIDWTLGRLRHRLPEMLAFAGMGELGEAARHRWSEVAPAIDRVAELLQQSRQMSESQRAVVVGDRSS